MIRNNNDKSWNQQFSYHSHITSGHRHVNRNLQKPLAASVRSPRQGPGERERSLVYHPTGLCFGYWMILGPTGITSSSIIHIVILSSWDLFLLCSPTDDLRISEVAAKFQHLACWHVMYPLRPFAGNDWNHLAVRLINFGKWSSHMSKTRYVDDSWE